METVRFGVIGLGNMGAYHLGVFESIQNAKVTAVCSPVAEQVQSAVARTGAQGFSGAEALLASKTIDALLIATPHMQHAGMAIAAMDAGLHVLCEKPIAVSVREAREVNAAAARHPDLKFGLMLQQRTFALYRKMRELIAGGELGDISRITWLVTDWFRTWTYYASGGWRATWAGEGGGVLINQCPHNLDLIQWVTGLAPSRVTAIASIGKTHPIEVEDEVSAILEYPTGAIGHFVTTTGEAPGTNRLEICGDRGKLIAENGKLSFHRTRHSVREVREKSPESFANPETWTFDVPLNTTAPEGHKVITQNFVNAILKNEPLIAPGEDGVKGLELGAAMQMAGLTRTPVALPINAEAFDQFLKTMAAQYGGKKTLKTLEPSAANMAASFR